MREAAGLSREALAQLVGVEARTVKHWEHGRTGVPADVAQVASNAAQWVSTAAQRLRLQSKRKHRGHPGTEEATEWHLDGSSRKIEATPPTPGAPVVLLRYRETGHIHRTEAATGATAETHGAAVVQALQGLALDQVPARVVWFDPAAYGAWVDAQRLADTPDTRQAWAEREALPAQAIPPRGDQPPPGFAPGYGTPSGGTTRTRSRP